MTDCDPLLEQTLRFVLSGVERELRTDIDWRAGGRGRNPISRAAIYAAALVRDLTRIPSHHPDGIAQARFRARIRYLGRTAIPTVAFFLDHYPLPPDRKDALASAVAELERCVGLATDGRIRALDEWYATMNEFAALSEGCRRAADALSTAIDGADSGATTPSHDPAPGA